jgi:hypothetical protein
MLSWAVRVVYFLITLWLLIFFYQSWYFTDLMNWIESVKTSFASFTAFFWVDPWMFTIISLIAVALILALVLSFKPSK